MPRRVACRGRFKHMDGSKTFPPTCGTEAHVKYTSQAHRATKPMRLRTPDAGVARAEEPIAVATREQRRRAAVVIAGAPRRCVPDRVARRAEGAAESSACRLSRLDGNARRMAKRSYAIADINNDAHRRCRCRSAAQYSEAATVDFLLRAQRSRSNAGTCRTESADCSISRA